MRSSAGIWTQIALHTSVLTPCGPWPAALRHRGSQSLMGTGFLVNKTLWPIVLTARWVIKVLRPKYLYIVLFGVYYVVFKSFYSSQNICYGHKTVVYILIDATCLEGNIHLKCWLAKRNIENVVRLSTNQNPAFSLEVWDNKLWIANHLKIKACKQVEFFLTAA